MKKVVLVVLSYVLFIALTGLYSFAQTDNGIKDEPKGMTAQQGMKMDEDVMKQRMEKCQPMMKQMMSHGMMKQDMMQMMMDMLTMQEKILKGPKAAEKKQMMKDIEQMKEKMHKMMSKPMDMMGMDNARGTKSKRGEDKEYPKAEPSKTDPHKH